MLPPAPARFSTRTCWPMLSPRNLATTRATVSVPPPGSKPTTMVIGLDGKLCAAQSAENSNAKSETTALIGLLLVDRALATLEDGLAFFHEGLAALLVILALEAFLRPRPALGRVVVDHADLADDALRGAHRERGVGRDGVGVLLHRGLQVFFRGHLVHQAHFPRFVRRELARGDHDLARVRRADDVDQVLHRRGAVAQAHLGRRDAEARVVGG